MNESNQRLTRRTSPELDAVVLVCTILTIALLVWAGWWGIRPIVAVAFHDCPAGSHAVWDSGHGGRALCGATFTGGVKAQ